MLCDFGLARIQTEDPSGLTTTASPKYTTRYASPELVMESGARITLASDVWAWGCLFLDVSFGFRSVHKSWSHRFITRLC